MVYKNETGAGDKKSLFESKLLGDSALCVKLNPPAGCCAGSIFGRETGTSAQQEREYRQSAKGVDHGIKREEIEEI
ncbi:MAG: hypothetical protein SV775_17620 [Thermodesulfobacteriota bacterium]|nr:hypothetical protein [Thermodesulfobacteriota bacterium]